MQTRSSINWKTYSGTFDLHNLKYCDFGKTIPCIGNSKPIDNNFDVVSAHNYRKITNTSLVNMFLYDYVLERFWRKPLKYIEIFQKAKYVMTPDYSLFVDMPTAVQIYNIFRNRLLGYIYQKNGINIIPTISWGLEETFDFCFNGIKENSVVAVSMVSINKNNFKYFDNGFCEMLRVIKPTQIVMQRGIKYRNLYTNHNIIDIDPFYFKFKK